MTRRRSEYAFGVRLARNYLGAHAAFDARDYGVPRGARLPKRKPVFDETSSIDQPMTRTMRAGVRYGLVRTMKRSADPWDRTSSRAQKALTYIPYNDQDGAARGASSFNIRRRNRGKNVGSFKTRKGQYVKGKGGRFVGSK